MIIETELEARERYGRALGYALEENGGVARFPVDGFPPSWDHEALVQARKNLFGAMEWLCEHSGQRVRFCHDEERTLVVWLADDQEEVDDV